MNRRWQIALVGVSLLTAAVDFTFGSSVEPATAAPPPQAQPIVPYATAAQFAWSLFVEAMTPTNAPGGNPLTFENWTEQCDLNPNQVAGCDIVPGGVGTRFGVRHAHGSPLERANALVRGHAQTGKGPRRGAAGSNQGSSAVGCGAMAQPNNEQNPGPTGWTGLPNNLIAYNPSTGAGPVFCEEVFVNPTEASFLWGSNSKSLNLTTLNKQQQYGNLTFPWGAIEIKVDWVPASNFTGPGNPAFACGSTQVYTEMIQFGGAAAQCYALVGFHINDKVLPDWLWATFEPNFPTTNPNRCNPALYDACYDPWGTTSSQPYQGTGQGQSYVTPSTMQQSTQLAQLMSRFGLNPAFNNYFLTGVQTQFLTDPSNPNSSPTLLGSSFVEFNASVNVQQGSCISCHNFAYYNGAGTPPGPPSGGQTGTSPQPGFGPATPNNPTGALCSNSTPPGPSTNPPCVGGVTGPQYTLQDFSWIMGLMPTSNYVGPAGKSAAGKSGGKPKQ